MVQPLYIKGKIAAKDYLRGVRQTRISTFGEELILQVRRRLTSRGKIKHQWRQSLDELWADSSGLEIGASMWVPTGERA